MMEGMADTKVSQIIKVEVTLLENSSLPDKIELCLDESLVSVIQWVRTVEFV